jgi:hypothetical protein
MIIFKVNIKINLQYFYFKAYKICEQRDLVPEMVFILGRMGNNKQALMLIIERLHDVQRVSYFSKIFWQIIYF